MKYNKEEIMKKNKRPSQGIIDMFANEPFAQSSYSFQPIYHSKRIVSIDKILSNINLDCYTGKENVK